MNEKTQTVVKEVSYKLSNILTGWVHSVLLHYKRWITPDIQ